MLKVEPMDGRPSVKRTTVRVLIEKIPDDVSSSSTFKVSIKLILENVGDVFLR